jgi:hypothetical protein
MNTKEEIVTVGWRIPLRLRQGYRMLSGETNTSIEKLAVEALELYLAAKAKTSC